LLGEVVSVPVEVVKIANETCVKEMVPVVIDIQTKYTYIIIVGIANIIVMSIIGYKFYKLWKSKKQ
jgi:hypothetical protein